MKKCITVIAIVSAVCLNSFAQGGNFTFNNNSASAVWDTTVVPSVKAGATLEVAVMWSANTSAVPTTYLGGAATPTNVPTLASWTGIFTDPNFQLARDTTAGNPPIVTACGGPAPLQGIYLGGVRYINGTAPLQTVQLYVLGWEKSYGTDPITAAINGAPVGFSSPIQFTLGSTILPGGGIGIAGISAFGVGVPEPSTCALAGIGVAALLVFRRRRRRY